jgi:hypothetical protein
MISHIEYEARVWKWPNVAGRARYTERVPLLTMLNDAYEDALRTGEGK